MKNFDVSTLKPYLWVLYPVLVFLIILVSLTWFAGGAGEIINALNSKNQKVQTELNKRNNMQTKLAILKGLNEKSQLDKLKDLSLTLPINNQPWVLLSQAKTVGRVTSFKNTSTGKSTTLELEAGNSDALVEILEKIDALKPLVSINSVQLGSGKVKLDAVSHWEALPKLTVALEEPLPNLAK